MTAPTSEPDLNYDQLDFLLERTKAKVFMGRYSNYLGSIMSKLNFFWDTTIGTACTNGVTIKFNPYFFLKCTEKGRVTIMKHELWHVAYLDCLRGSELNQEVWNWACDIRINNHLENEGESLNPADVGLRPWLDHQYDGMAPEEIYEAIYPIPLEDMISQYGELPESDLHEPDEPTAAFPEKVDRWTVLNNLIAATQAAKMSGGGYSDGGIPGECETILQRFLNPKLPWHQLMFNWFNAKYEEEYSMRKPNRRYQDVYMPSLMPSDEGGLDHLMFVGDVSGSVSDAEFIRYYSEVKYIKDHFNPELLTFVQFDTIIQSIKTWTETDAFDEVIRKGKGGTSLVPVRDLILERKPNAVVILSDFCCAPMEPIGNLLKVDILWVSVNNASTQVSEGKLIHMRE